jgi:hypothetical protein
VHDRDRRNVGVEHGVRMGKDHDWDQQLPGRHHRVKRHRRVARA